MAKVKGDTVINHKSIKLLRNEGFKKRIIELKQSEDYSSWHDLRVEINDEFDSNVSLSALRDSYNKSIATSVTVSGPKKNPFKDLVKTMATRLETISNISDVMANELSKQINVLSGPESDDMEYEQRLKILSSLSKTADNINNQIMKQLALVAGQLEQIKIEQTKMQWDESKVHEEMQKTLPLLLQHLEDEGKIAIIERSIL